MVWLHGGGFAYGSGSWPVYDGHNLAKKGDVVVVTVNHRLNVFGYLYLGELGRPGLRAVGQRRHARPGGGARVGARQHRPVRRRSRQRHHLRRVGRRRQGLDLDGDAGGERPLPQGDRRERPRAALDARRKAPTAMAKLVLEAARDRSERRRGARRRSHRQGAGAPPSPPSRRSVPPRPVPTRSRRWSTASCSTATRSIPTLRRSPPTCRS